MKTVLGLIAGLGIVAGLCILALFMFYENLMDNFLEKARTLGAIEYQTREELFDITPQGSDKLISEESLIVYNNRISIKPNTSAIAQSFTGTAGFVIGQADADAASKSALEKCQQLNREFEALAPCEVIYLHGKWIEESNRAIEILERLERWQPSEPVNPHKIYAGAYQDYEMADTDQTLVKILWLYQFSEFIDPDFSTARLNTVTLMWEHLSYRDPKANLLMHYAAIKLQEDTLEASDYAAYHLKEFIELNERLHFNQRSIQLFTFLHENHPMQAKMMYRYLDDLLLEIEEYGLYALYMEPEQDYTIASELHKRFEEHATEKQYTNLLLENYKVKIAQAVAIYMLTEREDEAKALAERAKADFNDAYFDQVLDQALQKRVVTEEMYMFFVEPDEAA